MPLNAVIVSTTTATAGTAGTTSAAASSVTITATTAAASCGYNASCRSAIHTSVSQMLLL